MLCKYLSCYTHVNKSWSVARCSFHETLYVPSMQELDNYCEAGRHEQCPIFFHSLPPLHDKYLWPELELVALAQCR